MKTNKIWLMFALLLIGATLLTSQEINAADRVNWTVPTKARTALVGNINFTVGLVQGDNVCNVTIDIRRTYNETAWTRVATLGNATGNQTNWGLFTLYNTAASTDGNYTINATSWVGCTGTGAASSTNVSVWNLIFDNSNPSATIQSHSNGAVTTGGTQTFWLTDASVTNCTLVLWYNNAYTYISNTSTATSGAGTPTPRSCTAVATSLPTGPIQAYFLSDNNDNPAATNVTVGDQTFKITLTGGSGGGSLTQQQTQLFQNTGGSTSTTEGSGSAIVIILIVLGLIFFLKNKRKR